MSVEREGVSEPGPDELLRDLERYRAAFEFAPHALLVTDVHGTIEHANVAAGRLFDVPTRLLVGKPLSAFLPAEERRRFRSALLTLPHVGDGRYELVIVTRSRERRVAAVTAAYGREGGNEPAAIHWALRDVTARTRVEEELRALNAELELRVAAQSEELARERAHLQTIVEQIPAGLIIAEAPSGRIVYANRQAEELLAGWERPLARAIERGEAVESERLEVESPDGTRRTLEVSAAPVRDSDGRIVGGVVTFHDVTARERRERAEREFVANAAHELRTPLAAITSAVEVLQAGAKEIPEERDRFLAHVERESHRLARLARSLLVLARAQTGQQAPKLELIELRPLLEQVAEGLQTRAGVELEIRCPAELAAVASRELTEQAVSSLAANAARYTEEGRIELRASRAGKRRVELVVSDTGPGISPEERELVFERFYRGGGRSGDGFGLGLAIARQAVEALGTTLCIDSEPGRGTTARLTLPSAKLLERQR